MESGPPPVKTRDGIWLKIYNGVSFGPGGHLYGGYKTGQMLLDVVNQPRGPPIARLDNPLLQRSSLLRISGQDLRSFGSMAGFVFSK